MLTFCSRFAVYCSHHPNPIGNEILKPKIMNCLWSFARINKQFSFSYSCKRIIENHSAIFIYHENLWKKMKHLPTLFHHNRPKNCFDSFSLWYNVRFCFLVFELNILCNMLCSFTNIHTICQMNNNNWMIRCENEYLSLDEIHQVWNVWSWWNLNKNAFWLIKEKTNTTILSSLWIVCAYWLWVSLNEKKTNQDTNKLPLNTLTVLHHLNSNLSVVFPSIDKRMILASQRKDKVFFAWFLLCFVSVCAALQSIASNKTIFTQE